MPLIVDTYNVLHVVGILPPELAGIDTRGLIDLVGRSRYRGERVLLICDGRPRERAPRGRFGPVSVRYAGAGGTADELIGALIQTSSSPRRLTVVSSDRQIVRAARRRRARTLGSDEFLGHLAHDAAARARPGGPRPAGGGGPRHGGGDVETWLEEFGVTATDGLSDVVPDPGPLPPSMPLRETPPETAGREQTDRAAGEGLQPTGDAGDAGDAIDRSDTLPPRLIEEAEALWREEE